MLNIFNNKNLSDNNDLLIKNKELNVRLESIAEVNKVLAGVVDKQRVFDLITKKLAPLVKMNFPTIWIYDKEFETIQLASHSVPDTLRVVAEKAIGGPISQLKFYKNNPEQGKSTYFKVIETRKPIFSDNLYTHTYPFLNERVANILEKLSGMKLAVSVPIMVQDQPMGVLSAIWQEKELSKENEITLYTFANQISTAIYNSNLFEQVNNQINLLTIKNRDLQSLFNLTSKVSASLDPQEVAQTAVDSLPQDQSMIGSVLGQYFEKENMIKVIATSRNQLSYQVEKLIGDFGQYTVDVEDPKLENNLTVKVIKTGQPQYTTKLEEYLSPPLPKQFVPIIASILNIKSIAAYPVISKGRIIGVLAYLLKSKMPEELEDNEKQLLTTYSNQVGIALENAILYKTSKEIQEHLETALKQLEEVRKHERDMIDIMGHELRTPISIVRNALVMIDMQIRKKPAQPVVEVSKLLSMAIDSTRREVGLIETLLSATKTEGKGFQLVLEKLNLLDIVQESLNGFQKEAEKKGLQVLYTPPAEPIYVYADKTRTQEAADNFFSNAVKYTMKGSIELSIKKDSQYGYLTVKDSGIGIAEDDLKRLGEKFFRARQYIDNKFATNSELKNKLEIIRPGGTGLGLFVTFNLIKVMGGKLDVQSKVGEGSEFTFGLPLFANQPTQQVERKVT